MQLAGNALQITKRETARLKEIIAEPYQKYLI
jgi:hypothetical protein